jgi:hypothetical protein
VEDSLGTVVERVDAERSVKVHRGSVILAGHEYTSRSIRRSRIQVQSSANNSDIGTRERLTSVSVRERSSQVCQVITGSQWKRLSR